MTCVRAVRRAEPAEQRAVVLAGGPVDVQTSGDPAQSRDVVGVRGRHGPQHTDATVEHELGGGHPGQQGDLGVPVLDRQRRPEAERPDITVRDDVLTGDGQVHPAAVPLALLPQRPDFAQELDGLGRGPGIQGPLHGRVVLLRAAADDCPVQIGADELAVVVEVERPHQGRPRLAGQQRPGAPAQHRRVQRHPSVGEVQRLGPPVRRQVQRSAGSHEGGDVGDGVPEAEP